MKLVDAIWPTRLYEGVTDIVYHFTSDPVSVFKMDTLLASAALDRDQEVGGKGSFFYLSTARSIASHYIPTSSSIGAVVLELDGRLLSHNSASNPVDYWQDGFTSEQEERFYLRSSKLYPASKYIRKIFVMTGLDKDYQVKIAPWLSWVTKQKSRLSQIVKESVKYGKRHGIPVVLVPSSSNKSGEARYAHPLEQTLDVDKVLAVYGESSGLFDQNQNKDMWANWTRHVDSVDVAAALYLVHCGRPPNTQAYSIRLIREGSFGYYLINFSTMTTLRSRESRHFLLHLLELLKGMGLKSLQDEEVRRFCKENFPSDVGSDLSREKCWAKVEAALPDYLRKKIETARNEEP